MFKIMRILYNLNKLHVIVVSVIAIIFGFLITIDNPLDQSEHELVTWIQTTTNKDAVFFGPETEIDTFKIRVFAKRAIWADDAFPFHEDYIKEFDRRRKIISNIERKKKTICRRTFRRTKTASSFRKSLNDQAICLDVG